VVASGPGTTMARPVGADATAVLDLDADGTWRLCARSGGGESGYLAAEDCAETEVRQPAPFTPPPPDVQPDGNPMLGGPTGGEASPAFPTELAHNDRPFTISVARRIRRGRAIKLTVTSTSRFSLRFTAKTSSGRTLVRYSRKVLSDGSWTFTFRVPSRYSRPGRAIDLRITIAVRGRSHAARRTVRYR